MLIGNSTPSASADFKNIISARVNLLNDEVFLRGLNMFELQNASVSVLRGLLVIEIKKPNVRLNQIQVNFDGSLEEKTYNGISGSAGAAGVAANAATSSNTSDSSNRNSNNISGSSSSNNSSSTTASISNSGAPATSSASGHSTSAVTLPRKNSFTYSSTQLVSDRYQWDFSDQGTLVNVTDNIKEISDDNSSANLPGVYCYPFQFVVDSSFPQSISALFNSVSYHISSSIKFDYINKNRVFHKELQLQRPVKLLRCVFDELILDNNQVIIEGSFKKLFNYEVSLSNRVIYFNDTINLKVKVTPTSPIYYQNDFYKVKMFKLFFLQNYDPANQLHCRKKKYLLKEHPIKDDDMNKNTGEIEFDLTVNFRDILSHGFVYPSFFNQEGIVKFSVNHYFKSVFVLEERRFDKIKEADLPEYNTSDHANAKFTFNHPGSSGDSDSDDEDDNESELRAYRDHSNSTASSNRTSLNLTSRSSTINNGFSEQEIVELAKSSKYTTKYTQLTLKSPVILLSEESKMASMPPPSYEVSNHLDTRIDCNASLNDMLLSQDDFSIRSSPKILLKLLKHHHYHHHSRSNSYGSKESNGIYQHYANRLRPGSSKRKRSQSILVDYESTLPPYTGQNDNSVLYPNLWSIKQREGQQYQGIKIIPPTYDELFC